MYLIRKIQSFLFLLVIGFFSGCIDKFDLSEIDTGSGNINIGGDTVFVRLNPVWSGFNKPQDILIGREPFIYVADTDNDRIVMLNLDGQVLGTRTIKKPVALAQDHRLNLIVCAQFDTLNQTFSAVYKLDLFSVSHQIETAPIKRLLPRAVDLNRPLLEYTGVAAFSGNVFYVARTGPNNSSFVDPDNSILIFNPKKLFGIESSEDTLIGRVPNIDPIGQGPVSAFNISSIKSFNNRTTNMILTLTGNNSFKTQVLDYIITPIDQRYQSRFSPSSGVEIMRPNKFVRPEGSATDNSGNFYVADAGTDSIFKFNAFGDELQSFGGPDVFDQPYAVAFFDRTLYVADTGNNRILRFILSTDQ
jgi:DNA-binding beta-propeller fold protein YncE